MTVLDQWDETAAEELTRAAFEGGWGRLHPIATGILNAVAVRLRPCTTQELTAVLLTPDDAVAWDEDCWIEPEHFTDEALRSLDAAFPEEADGRSAAEVNADLDAEHAKRIATADAYAAHLGLGPVRTCRDLLTLLVAAGALHQDGDTVHPVLPVPRVDDVFPVSEEERQDLAALRALNSGMDVAA